MLLSFDLGLKHMGACAIEDDGKIVSWIILRPKSPSISDIVLELDTWISCVNTNNKCTRVVLERQPWNNRKMTRLLVIMETYLVVSFPSFTINKIASNMKWKFLMRDVPSTYYERKRESIKSCENLLTIDEKNKVWLEWFLSQEKKDDLADAYIQGLVML